MKLIVAPIAIMLVLTGCIPFPRYITTQPDITIQVQDQAGIPIPDANILIISAFNPHRVLHKKTTLITDSHGIAKLNGEAEWEIMYPYMPHGVRHFYWSWCISKNGYVSSSNETREISLSTTTTLKKGESIKCSNDQGYILIGNQPN